MRREPVRLVARASLAGRERENKHFVATVLQVADGADRTARDPDGHIVRLTAGAAA